MRDKILNTATEMFLNLGFKSVTMDDIANEMAISKKTIYAHFDTKTKLVQAVTNHLFENIDQGIKDIRAKKMNPIEEIYEIKSFSMKYLKDEKTSPQYQLQKYYPKIYKSISSRQYELVQCCVIENLECGITTGHYRSDIPISFISRIHFTGMMGLKDKDLFPTEEYSNAKLMEYFVEYHIRAISTPKGLKTLQEFLNKRKNINHA
ncbi:MAG: TetR/AcrR family transcriptional regulator [Bacteroidota bacterium]|nr:TetR/AcrR family transcriptional regulator [Salegentibacter flavus]